MIDEPFEESFQDELNVLYVGDNHYRALVPLVEQQDYMDLQESECDDDDQKINENELASFQKNLLKDEDIEINDEPEIYEEPYEKYDFNYIKNWIKNNIENYQFKKYE